MQPMMLTMGIWVPSSSCPTRKPMKAAKPICKKPIIEAAAPAMRGKGASAPAVLLGMERPPPKL